MVWIWFLVGLWLGGAIGFFLGAALGAKKVMDEHADRALRQLREQRVHRGMS